MNNHEYVGIFTSDPVAANKMMNAMKKYDDNKWWLSENGDYMAYMQVNEDVLLIESEALQKNIENLLGREVPFFEFKMSPARIREEVIKRYNDKYHGSQMNDENKTVIYCRTSTREQSVESMKEKCIQYAFIRGLKVYRIFIDEGFSANDLERPALMELKEYMKHNTGGNLIVSSMDRLYRDSSLTTHFYEFADLTEYAIFVANEKSVEPIEHRLHGLVQQLKAIEEEHIKQMATSLLVQPIEDLERLLLKVADSEKALLELYNRVGKALGIINERAPELHREISELLMGRYDGE